MPKPNRTFELTIDDLDLIEEALRTNKLELAQARLKEGAKAGVDDGVRRIQDLLGRLHNQKTFFRPKKAPYVGG